jgi:predicted house-cleaning noncanonical NTP pyrophosphatase (MazG superfamily)
MTKKYHKLVRDRIPEIIEKEGLEKAIFRILDKEEFFEPAKKKVLEEAEELVAARSKKDIIDEIVDILELIDTLIAEMGISRLEICTLRRKKNLKKGAFEKRVFLIGTESKPRA